MMRRLFPLALLLPLLAAADERILSFHSDIVVRQDGRLQVTETIRVRAEGDRIHRGIYRDFPTDYRDAQGNRYVVEFVPIAVLRNDAIESFHSQRIKRGVRVYFGSANRHLPPGEHTYEFRYEANRLLGYFDDHDELYWNVTGFEWAFPIDTASATVRFDFPVAAGELSQEAYTGPYGARGDNYVARIDAAPGVHFRATEPLSPQNGLTIVVAWPKGFVSEPDALTRAGWLLGDNLNLLVAFGGLLLMLAWYVPVWLRYGKDPDGGVLVTRYEPPEGFSPASLRYIEQMHYDDKVMTAAVVNLAVKGYLRIDVNEGSDGFLGIGGDQDEYSLTRLEPGSAAPRLAAGEQELLQALFAEGDSVQLTQENHELLGDAKSAHRKSLRRDYNRRYFRWNWGFNIPGVVIAVLSMIIALQFGVSLYVLVVGALMLVMIGWFFALMRAPTIRGRELLDEMLGFKDYLEVAERDELNLRNPPEKTPQLFEAYLPFALALGVDQRWSEKFAGVLGSIRQPDGSAYHPAWYGGRWDSGSIASTTSTVSSALNTAIASSVTPPGSTSGSGGFSGGGGGGGGGGGW
jgi:uncharacterized membrane protein YgcG